MKKFEANESVTLKNFTDNVCAQASFCFRTLLKEREIKVNGKRVGSDVMLHEKDVVEYYMTARQEQKKAFYPLFEDENVFVIDKESGVNSEAVFFETGLFPVHRLDRNTAGVMILAKSQVSQEELISLFGARKVEKIYLCVVVGKMEAPHKILKAKLLKGENGVLVGERGAEIVTEYEVLEEREETSLLKVILHTGKTHQIRAHLAYLGHPIAGDEKYGDSSFNRAHHLSRQQLVSKSLTLFPEGSLSYLNGKVFSSPRNL